MKIQFNVLEKVNILLQASAVKSCYVNQTKTVHGTSRVTLTPSLRQGLEQGLCQMYSEELEKIMQLCGPCSTAHAQVY